jgi:hypothetical protein
VQHVRYDSKANTACIARDDRSLLEVVSEEVSQHRERIDLMRGDSLR